MSVMYFVVTRINMYLVDVRSSKYHDKAVDSLYVTGNGYLVTASTGSKFVKVWKIQHAQGEIVMAHADNAHYEEVARTR